jgi:hypothetical protein
MHIEGSGFVGVDWMRVAKGRDHWGFVMSAVFIRQVL